MDFRPGETVTTRGIFIHDDSHDDGGETFEVYFYDAEGALIADGVAVSTIENDDPLPAAWLKRFGRTVAEQALDGIAGRMAVPRTAGMQGTIAGQALSFDPAAGVPAAGGNPAGPGGTDPFGAPQGQSLAMQSRTMTARDALLGSSFSLTGERDGAGGSLAFWGRASQGRFDGTERGDGTEFTLDGTVTTGLLGADYAHGKWLLGLALAKSSAEGDYAALGDGNPSPETDGGVPAGDGSIEAAVTAAIPYAALQASERLELWGAAGYGTGEVTVKTDPGDR